MERNERKMEQEIQEGEDGTVKGSTDYDINKRREGREGVRGT